MDVCLREITRKNFWECILLKSTEYKGLHLFEPHVTSNAFSIAQASVEPEWVPKAIYAGEQVVGFVMYGLEQTKQIYFVTRLMIDYRHQGKGYGKKGMLLAIEEIKKRGTTTVYTSIVPTNEKAKLLYTNLGFVETGEFIEFGEEKEPLYCLRIT